MAIPHAQMYVPLLEGLMLSLPGLEISATSALPITSTVYEDSHNVDHSLWFFLCQCMGRKDESCPAKNHANSKGL